MSLPLASYRAMNFNREPPLKVIGGHESPPK